MASPGQSRGTCGHAMALFDSHTKCARCRDKGLGQDPCVEKKDCAICNSFTEDQKLQLATPTYRARKDKELQKKNIASPSLVDPSTVTVVGKVESGKGDSSDRGKTPTKKKKASHKSPKKISKPPKNPDLQSDLKKLDDKAFYTPGGSFPVQDLSAPGGTGSELQCGGVRETFSPTSSAVH